MRAGFDGRSRMAVVALAFFALGWLAADRNDQHQGPATRVAADLAGAIILLDGAARRIAEARTQGQ